MKTLITLSFLFFLTPFVFSQTKVIEYFNSGKIKLNAFVKDNIYDSIYISYHENGNKAIEGSYKNFKYKTNSMSINVSICRTGKNKPSKGLKNGQWKYFYQDGKLEKVENYIGDVMVGQRKLYDSIGNLLINEFYNAGVLVQQQEYDNGLLKKFTNRTYEENKKDFYITYIDKVFEYYKTGELKSIKTFNEQKEEIGKYIEYWENGFVKAEGKYKNKEKNGVFREYYENGNTEFEGMFKNDKPKDKQYYYNEKGKIIKIQTWKKGKLIRTEEKTGN